jgi:transketolase
MYLNIRIPDCSNAVGFAMAESHLAAVFNRDGHDIVDHYTYFICSDGDLMEGISHEASSFAGHYKFGKLIGFYDDNRITIDGSTDLTYTDDAGKRFEAYGWHVLHVEDVNDLEAVDAAIEAAKAETGQPTMIVCRTHIGFGSPNKQDTAKAHGEPLGAEEIKLTKRNLGWPTEESFFVPDEALAHWRKEIAARDARRTGAAEPLFVPVHVTPLPGPLEVALPGGRVVRVPAGFDPAHLRAVVAALEGVPC